MTNPNFGLLMGAGNGFQNALAMGMQYGQMARQRSEEKEYRNALAGYDPANPETIKPIMAIDPRTGIQLQRDAAAQAQTTREQRQVDAATMRRLLGHAKGNPQQAYAAAQGMGIDLSGVPAPDSPEFQPWVDQQLFLFDALDTKEGQEILSTAGKQAYDEGLRPGDGKFEQRVTEIWQQNGAIPYVGPGGETRLYVPGRTQQVGPEPGSLVGGFKFRGGNPNDPNAWEPVQGGPAAPAGAGFPGR